MYSKMDVSKKSKRLITWNRRSITFNSWDQAEIIIILKETNIKVNGKIWSQGPLANRKLLIFAHPHLLFYNIYDTHTNTLFSFHSFENWGRPC
jgi:hypothetical protein